MIQNVRIFATLLTVLISTKVLGSDESNLIDWANDFQDRVTTIQRNIDPSGPAISGVPPRIEKPEEAVDFFNDERTLHGLTVLLDMSDAAEFKTQIEALKILFERGRNLAETAVSQAK